MGAGVPQATFIWRHRKTGSSFFADITNRGRVGVGADGNRISTLTFKSLSDDLHDGDYQCQAENIAGTDTSRTLTLNIRSKSVVTSHEKSLPTAWHFTTSHNVSTCRYELSTQYVSYMLIHIVNTMSARVSTARITCQFMSVCVSTICQHLSIHVSLCQYLSVRVGTCDYMSVHISSYQHSAFNIIMCKQIN